MKNYLFTISIVTMNRINELERALKSVYKQTYKNFEIVIIDNNSTDETVETIKNKYPDIKLIKLNKNIGCPAARNISVKYAKGEIIFFLDDDAWLEENVLEEINKQFAIKDENVKIIFTNIIQHTKNITYKEFDDLPEPILMPYFLGGVSAIKKEVFENVTKYPDYHYGGEEADMSIKLYLKNFKIILLPYIYAHHQPSEIRDSKIIFYNKTKNILIWDLLYAHWLILPLIFVWNSFTYSYNAYKNHNLTSSLKAVYNVIKELPNFFIIRKPLSLKLFIKYIIFRKKAVKKIRTRKILNERKND